MNKSVTLYRFRIDLSDIDRGVYTHLDFRVALHPSEGLPFLLTRVLAFALNTQDGLQFSAEGLHDPDEPCLMIPSAQGGYDLWIEVGNPSAKKLHKASKSSRVTKVYTYKDPRVLLREIEGAGVHKADAIEIFALPSVFLDNLAQSLERDNKWSVLLHEGALSVSSNDKTETCTLASYQIAK